MVGEIGLISTVVLIAVVVGVTAGVVSMTMGARQIPVQIPRKVRREGTGSGGSEIIRPNPDQRCRRDADHLRPVVHHRPRYDRCLLSLAFLSRSQQHVPAWNRLYYSTYGILIIFFTYFYTAIIFNPVDLAENLKKQGAFIPGVKPGARTAEYIDRVLTRVLVPGSIYLAMIAMVPFWIFDIFNIQTFFFGGTGLLIVVGVGLDTVQRAQQHLLLRHYDGFMKKGRVKVRGRQRYT